MPSWHPSRECKQGSRESYEAESANCSPKASFLPPLPPLYSDCLYLFSARGLGAIYADRPSPPLLISLHSIQTGHKKPRQAGKASKALSRRRRERWRWLEAKNGRRRKRRRRTRASASAARKGMLASTFPLPRCEFLIFRMRRWSTLVHLSLFVRRSRLAVFLCRPRSELESLLCLLGMGPSGREGAFFKKKKNIFFLFHPSFSFS